MFKQGGFHYEEKYIAVCMYTAGNLSRFLQSIWS